MGESLLNQATFVLQKDFTEFTFANEVKVAISCMLSLIQEKKNLWIKHLPRASGEIGKKKILLAKFVYDTVPAAVLFQNTHRGS